jgi:putative FmdB family regulatory protein
MPLYEYRCTDCGTEFEKNLPFSASNQLPPCPTCQSPQTRKKLSAVASFGNASSGVSLSSGSSCGGSGRFT